MMENILWRGEGKGILVFLAGRDALLRKARKLNVKDIPNYFPDYDRMEYDAYGRLRYTNFIIDCRPSTCCNTAC